MKAQNIYSDNPEIRKAQKQAQKDAAKYRKMRQK